MPTWCASCFVSFSIEENLTDIEYKAGWPTELLQVPALGCIKLSFLFFYRRVFVKFVAREFSFANLFMIAAVVSWTICFFFLLLFLCGTDFSAYWTNGTTEALYCLPTGKAHMAYAISDVVSDIVIILMPVGEVRTKT